MDVRIRYVVKRGSSYRFRRRPPPDVASKLLDGRGSWIRTWPVDTPLTVVQAEAQQLVARQNQAIILARGDAEAELIEEANRDSRGLIRDYTPAELAWYQNQLHDGEMDARTAALANALSHGGDYQRDTVSLTEALRLDRERHSSDKNRRPFDLAIKLFVAVIGDRDVTRITRMDVSEFIAHERRRGLAPASIRRHLAALRAVVNRAHLDMDHPGRNPFERHSVPGGGGSPSDRLPFNRQHLELIDGYIETSSNLSPDTRNLIRIMRDSGMGPAEAGGLVAADVSLDGEVPFVWVRQNSVRRLKNSSRTRQVPMVGQALEAITDAVERAGDRKELFTGYGASGRGADFLSATLNAAIRRAGVPRSPRLTSYSFRHGMVAALSAAGVQDDLRRRLMGHAAPDMHGKYGAPNPQLVKLQDAMLAALEHLGDIADSNYTETERLT